MLAIEQDNDILVDWLLDNRADIHITNAQEQNALHLGQLCGFLDLKIVGDHIMDGVLPNHDYRQWERRTRGLSLWNCAEMDIANKALKGGTPCHNVKHFLGRQL
jgi:hypothetical protein